MFRFVLAASTLICTTSFAWAGASDLFSEKVKDFGTTPRGPVLVHYFRVTNTTNQTISFGQPRVSCGCTSASMSVNKIAPGESAAVIALMDTRRITTPYTTKSVIVYVPVITGNNFEEVALRVQTVCRDDLMMSPDTIVFGDVQHGVGGRKSMKVTFTSDANWKVTEATSTGKFVKAEIKEDSRNGSIVTYEITAVLDKDCPAGHWISDINLKTSNAGVATLRVPVTVNVAAPSAAASSVTITPNRVQLGEINLGTSVEKNVVIKSGTSFKILEVKGDDAQLEVKIESQGAKAEHVVTLSAKPTTVGGFARSIEIVTDSKDQPSVIVPVVAKVIGP